ncbi:MAG: hypothetical protein PHE59_04685 [Patescibacteria group bacterium]|nr:hypothetical protein [Patescibacteria group bacterium]MDD5534833.1 hypothetical protein [Patescibacteria group bacterium]
MKKEDYIPEFRYSDDFSWPDTKCPFYKDCEPYFGVLCMHPDAPKHHTKRVACRPEYCPLLEKKETTPNTIANVNDRPSLTDPCVKLELFKIIT